MGEDQQNQKKEVKEEEEEEDMPGGHRILPDKGVTEREAKLAESLATLLGYGIPRELAIKVANDVSYKPSEASRSVTVYQVLGKDRVQKYLSSLLTKAGLGQEAVTGDLRRAITLGLSSGDAKVGDAIKGLELAMKMHNMFPAQRVESTSVRINTELMQKNRRALKTDLEGLEVEEAELLEEGELIGKKDED